LISKYTRIKVSIEAIIEDFHCDFFSDADDYTVLWNKLRESISLVKGGKPGPGQGSFGHITGGYDAGYYGYVSCVRTYGTMQLMISQSYTYSLVFAADMYATVFKKDPLDPAKGKLYRDKILRVGGSREETDTLKVKPSLLARLDISLTPVSHV
jgi:metallopeptidase MepB